MRIEASTAMRQEAGKPDQFLGPEPEPINLKATLTEDGWDVLKQAMIGK